MNPEIYADIYILIGTTLSSLIGYGIVRLGKYLSAKTKNELVGGVTYRLTNSISDAVDMVNQTVKKKLKESRDPNSDGGEKITSAESAALRSLVWQELRSEYGGAGGLLKFLGLFNMGPAAAGKKIDTMIEAEVHRKKI